MSGRTTGFLATSGDEGLEVVAVDPYVLGPELDERDPILGAESPDEADARAEAFGGLLDGEQHGVSLLVRADGQAGLAVAVDALLISHLSDTFQQSRSPTLQAISVRPGPSGYVWVRLGRLGFVECGAACQEP